MKPSSTIYCGTREYDGQVIVGVRVTVNGKPLDPSRSQSVRFHASGFEWSYSGGGPLQLALALILDATGDVTLALRTYHFFKRAKVRDWADSWQITAGEIRRWVEEAEREDLDEYGPPSVVIGPEVLTPAPGCYRVPRCRECGCTEMDCSQCVEATGFPCSWVEGEDPPICSRCAEAEDAALIREMEGGEL